MDSWMMTGMILTFAVIFVNGWTDASNAITTVVATGGLAYRQAASLAALCNFFGVIAGACVCPAVSDAISSILDLSLLEESSAGRNVSEEMVICAAMMTILFWSMGAWYFGIPTSESHSLIAALTGAAFAVEEGELIQWSTWLTVLSGMLGSVVLGFSVAYLFEYLRQSSTRFAERFSGEKNVGFSSRRKRRIRHIQILMSVFLALTHGVQDGQKFLGIIWMTMLSGRVVFFNAGSGCPGTELQGRVTVICALIMAAGTLTGGKRIIEKTGNGLAVVSQEQGICADGAAAACLLGASILGYPVSTTHVKVAATVGAAVAGEENGTEVHNDVVRELVLTWVLTFPGCMAMGFVLMRGFMIY